MNEARGVEEYDLKIGDGQDITEACQDNGLGLNAVSSGLSTAPDGTRRATERVEGRSDPSESETARQDARENNTKQHRLSAHV